VVAILANVLDELASITLHHLRDEPGAELIDQELKDKTTRIQDFGGYEQKSCSRVEGCETTAC
jgi:hypothetical protein